MGAGILEVLLQDAEGIKENDFLGCLGCLNPWNHATTIDLYVVIQYGNQECRSCVAQRKGRKLEWNETLRFEVDYPGDEDDKKLIFRIMDKHKRSEDDYVGKTTIYVEDVVSIGMEKGKGKMEVGKYRVVREDKTYDGEISVAITFTRNE